MQLAKRRILYTEDHNDTRDYVFYMLTHFDYEVVTANNAEDALRLAQGECFDLYLLDVRLPDFSGVELCERIREFDSDTPILFYTAAAYDSDRQKAIKCGAQGFLTKPEGLDELGQTIKRLIGN